MKTYTADPALISRAPDAVSTSPVSQAYYILHWGFAALPIIAGVDKFFDKLAYWPQYLWPQLANLAGGAQRFMTVVGVVEILAGLLVAVKPKIGAYVVAAWLLGIIGNLLLLENYYDIALRDFGLLLGALALGRLARGFSGVHSSAPPAAVS
jgi:hypothetical protein